MRCAGAFVQQKPSRRLPAARQHPTSAFPGTRATRGCFFLAGQRTGIGAALHKTVGYTRDVPLTKAAVLYSLHEMQHLLAEPTRLTASALARLRGSPREALAGLPAFQRAFAGAELVLRLTRRYPKPAWRIASTRVRAREVPVDVVSVDSLPFCELLHFRRDTARRDPAVLMVAPLSGHHATLLRDTVRAFLPEHEVYITDWVNAREVPLHEGSFGLADYTAYVQRYLDLLGPEVHVLAVCQPTVPVLAATALNAANGRTQPASLTLIGGPVDTRHSPTSVNNFAKRYPLDWFEHHVVSRVPLAYPGRLRRVYPGFLQHAGFVSMNLPRHVDAHRKFFDHLVEGDRDSATAHREFYDEYNAVLDLTAEFYLETLKHVFQQHDLPRGELFVRDERVSLPAVSGPAVMTLEGELDDIAGLGQTKAALPLLTGVPAGRKRHLEVPGVGHYGTFSGRRFREQIYPRLRAFVRESARPRAAIPATRPNARRAPR